LHKKENVSDPVKNKDLSNKDLSNKDLSNKDLSNKDAEIYMTLNNLLFILTEENITR